VRAGTVIEHIRGLADLTLLIADQGSVRRSEVPSQGGVGDLRRIRARPEAGLAVR
jgi:hypothetical protein